MAPGEGLEPPTKWLIPKAFGTLPTAYERFNVPPALLSLDFSLTTHCLRPCLELLRMNTHPGPLTTLRVL